MCSGNDVAIWGNLFGCTKGLLAKYGKERVRDTPISEAALMGCTVGSAAAGLRPVAEIMYIDSSRSPWTRSSTTRPAGTSFPAGK